MLSQVQRRVGLHASAMRAPHSSRASGMPGGARLILTARVGHAQAVLGSKLYVFGGRAGVEIPRDVLWRAKAMQCEGIGENWVATLQAALSARVSDAELAASGSSRLPRDVASLLKKA